MAGYAGRRHWMLVLAGGLLLIAGCIEESPIAFSPDGKSLAFVTVEPYRTEGSFVVGPQAFRLMVLNEQRQIRVLETSTDTMLSGPAFSPDGRRLAYLRMPLPTWEQAERSKKEFDERAKSLQKIAEPAWMQWVAGQQESSTTQPAPAKIEIQDQSLFPLKNTYIAVAMMMLSANTTATLVLRDVQTGTIASSTPIDLPASGPDSMYVGTRLQFDPAGREIYFGAGNLVLAVDPGSGQKRIVAAGSSDARLSPDGRMLATAVDDAAGVVATDGSLAVYRRLPATPAAGPAWIDSQTLAVIQNKVKVLSAQAPPAATRSAYSPSTAAATQEISRGVFVVQRMRRDGTLLGPIEIPLPREVPADATVDQFTVGPDGRNVVISLANAAVFATLEGRAFGYCKQNDRHLQQAAFSPDSGRVAFKVLEPAGEKTLRTTDITFFSPEGRELYRVPIPPIAAGTTQPASQPTTEGGR